MYTEDFIQALESELASIEKKLCPLMAVYQAYLSTLDEDIQEQKRTKFPVSEETFQTRADLIPLAKVAIENFPSQMVFKAEDVFDAIGRSDLDFERVRTTLSRFLSQEAEEGRLEKVTRGNYRRVVLTRRRSTVADRLRALAVDSAEGDSDEAREEPVVTIRRRRRSILNPEDE